MRLGQTTLASNSSAYIFYFVQVLMYARARCNAWRGACLLYTLQSFDTIVNQNIYFVPYTYMYIVNACVQVQEGVV